MKRATAIRNLNSIVRKVRDINGIYATPLCTQDFIKIKRIWVFGSVAKGSALPSDLDIFVEVNNSLESEQPRRKGRQKIYRTTGHSLRLHGSYKMNKSSKNRAIPSAVSSQSELYKWLIKGTKKTSVHFVDQDETFSSLDCKYLVYPRNDFEELKYHGHN